jgi:hypothetical protein
MVFKEPISQQKLSFLKGIFDLKKYVSIYTRKQIGQKMEGVSAS